MKAVLILVVASLASVLVSCFLKIDLCPKDQNLGRLKLTNPGFSPYRGNETLTFVNQSGNQLKLTNFEYATLSTERRLVVSTPCYKSDLVKQQIYYDRLYIFISYRQNKGDYLNTINYSFGIEDLRADQSISDTLLAEVLTISNTFIKPSSMLRVLVSDRGSLARFDPIKGQYPTLIKSRIIPDTLLGGFTYKQVYASRQSPTLFFTQKEGIVAFKDEREWWYRLP